MSQKRGWTNSDQFNYDFSKEEECRAWLAKKSPFLEWNFLAFFGMTTACKSSIVCAIIGAQVAAVKDVGCNTCTNFILGVGDTRFQKLSMLTKRREALTVENVEELLQEDPRTPIAKVRVANDDRLWPTPRPSECSAVHDPDRFGDIYVSYEGVMLRAAFERVIPKPFHSLLGNSRFTIYNVDRVTSDPELRRRLMRTVFLDTKGLDTPEVSPAGASILTLATRNVFCVAPVFQDNRVAVSAFEQTMMQSVFGKSWLSENISKLAALASVPLALAFGVKGAIDVADLTAGAVQGLAGANKPDPAHQRLWRNTTFVRCKLDKSLEQQWGYEQAVQDAGTALGYFMVKPINKRVRHVAVPAYAAAQVDALQKKNELDKVREELLEPNTGGDLCANVAAYRAFLEEEPKKGWYNPVWWCEAALPRSCGINSDKDYARFIWEAQCKETTLSRLI